MLSPCRSNLERTKMRPDPKKMGTDAFCLNLALVGLVPSSFPD